MTPQEVLTAVDPVVDEVCTFLTKQGYIRNNNVDCIGGIMKQLGFYNNQLVNTKGVYGFHLCPSQELIKFGQGRLSSRHSGNSEKWGDGQTKVAFLVNSIHPDHFAQLEIFVKSMLNKLKEVNVNFQRLFGFIEDVLQFQYGLPHLQLLLQTVEYGLAKNWNASVSASQQVPCEFEFAAFDVHGDSDKAKSDVTSEVQR